MKKVDVFKARTIGEYCRLVRTRVEPTQTGMSKRLKLAHGTICEIENDRNNYPKTYLKRLRQFVSEEEYKFAWELMCTSLWNDMQGEVED
jgi:DNA-binding XRE family transcriptional regulator